jgi:hypothetical protein
MTRITMAIRTGVLGWGVPIGAALSVAVSTVAAAPTPASTVEPPAAGCEAPDQAPQPAPSQLGNFGDAFLLDRANSG